MVLDIEKYPEFVPWCIEGKVYEKSERLRIERIIRDLLHIEMYLSHSPTSFRQFCFRGTNG